MKSPGLLLPLEEVVPLSLLKAEVAAWAKRIGVSPREVHVRPMKLKWASCSSRGRLTFDAGLLRQSAAFRAEAIAHELLHLKVPNHGRVFNALLKTHLVLAGQNMAGDSKARLVGRSTDNAKARRRSKG